VTHLKAIIAVIIMAGVLSLPLYFYSDFLNRGRSPTKSSQILNELEKNGLKDFSLPEFETDKSFSLAQFKGQVVLLNFWATWCVPCVKEIPSMIHLAEKMQGKLVILALSQDKEASDLKAFLKAFAPYPENFHVLWDKERKVADAYGTEVLPESYVISPQLKLVRKVVGVETWDHAQAFQFFHEIYETGKAP
jgi:thiol-disulfide isomerase/thioredoxin